MRLFHIIKELVLFMIMEDKKNKADYSTGKIYKIVCNKTGLVYIGSTYRSLEDRIKEHAYGCKRYLEKKSNASVSSIYVIYYNDYKIELIESYPCSNKKELEEKEYYYISQIDCVNSMRLQKSSIYSHLQFIDNKKKPDYIIAFHNIMNKFQKEDLIKILFRYGIDEYKKNHII